MKEQEQKHNGFPPSNLPRDPETGYFSGRSRAHPGNL